MSKDTSSPVSSESEISLKAMMAKELKVLKRKQAVAATPIPQTAAPTTKKTATQPPRTGRKAPRREEREGKQAAVKKQQAKQPLPRETRHRKLTAHFTPTQWARVEEVHRLDEAAEGEPQTLSRWASRIILTAIQHRATATLTPRPSAAIPRSALAQAKRNLGEINSSMAIDLDLESAAWWLLTHDTTSEEEVLATISVAKKEWTDKKTKAMFAPPTGDIKERTDKRLAALSALLPLPMTLEQLYAYGLLLLTKATQGNFVVITHD
jgi:hypothetical protein